MQRLRGPGNGNTCKQATNARKQATNACRQATNGKLPVAAMSGKTALKVATIGTHWKKLAHKHKAESPGELAHHTSPDLRPSTLLPLGMRTH